MKKIILFFIALSIFAKTTLNAQDGHQLAHIFEPEEEINWVSFNQLNNRCLIGLQDKFLVKDFNEEEAVSVSSKRNFNGVFVDVANFLIAQTKNDTGAQLTLFSQKGKQTSLSLGYRPVLMASNGQGLVLIQSVNEGRTMISRYLVNETSLCEQGRHEVVDLQNDDSLRSLVYSPSQNSFFGASCQGDIIEFPNDTRPQNRIRLKPFIDVAFADSGFFLLDNHMTTIYLYPYQSQSSSDFYPLDKHKLAQKIVAMENGVAAVIGNKVQLLSIKHPGRRSPALEQGQEISLDLSNSEVAWCNQQKQFNIVRKKADMSSGVNDVPRLPSPSAAAPSQAQYRGIRAFLHRLQALSRGQKMYVGLGAASVFGFCFYVYKCGFTTKQFAPWTSFCNRMKTRW